jgi:hypothetical protein
MRFLEIEGIHSRCAAESFFMRCDHDFDCCAQRDEMRDGR